MAIDEYGTRVGEARVHAHSHSRDKRHGGIVSSHPLKTSERVRYIRRMRLMCIARHPFLTEHLCRYFDDLGAEMVPCVGMEQAMALVGTIELDAVICDYDLLAATPMASWESDPLRSGIPLIAVSLTRHPGD